MTPTPDPRRARLGELLGIKATQGLTPAEANELSALLAAFPDEDPEALELAAAAVHLALSEPPGEMPAALAEKLHLAAVAFAPPRSSPKPQSRPAWLTWTGWIVAASLLAALVYTNWPKKEPTVAQKRGALIGDATAKPTTFEDSKPGASGNVVWSNSKPEGYLEVRGLAPNDSTKEQYQLWIVDSKRPGEDPISGGVFDVNPDGTAVIPVHAAIQVKDAAAFAITKEVPGGVWKSKGPMLVVMTPKQG